MGLDIRVYQGIKPLPDHPFTDDCRELEHVRPYSEFEHSMVGIPYEVEDGRTARATSCYEPTGESFGFRAGSYSGYSLWREALSQAALGVVANDVWENIEEYSGKPFFELIHFSDCEGMIGAVCARKLAFDFETFDPEKLRLNPGGFTDDQYIEVYRDFQRAFRLAGDGGGVVVFT